MLFKYLKNSTLAFFLIGFTLACQPKEVPLSKEYLDELKAYHQELRAGRDHYLKLTGLFPLTAESQTFGMGSDSDILIKSDLDLPSNIGVITIKDDTARCSTADGLVFQLVNESTPINDWTYDFRTSNNGKLLKHKHLEWQVIKRGAEYFLRVKDQESELEKHFKGFQKFEPKKKYVVEADYMPFEESKTETILAQRGPNQTMDFAGILSFKLDGKSHQLWVDTSGFLIVGDLTNDDTTYGGGRYIDLELPKTHGKVVIDFNKLYNPPCVYSEFTTCPLPPKQNQLNLSINAGEKYQRI